MHIHLDYKIMHFGRMDIAEQYDFTGRFVPNKCTRRFIQNHKAFFRKKLFIIKLSFQYLLNAL
jgi:hypothetical protein